ncbi:hypothetical protein CR513_23364, partial [Mucuna pruriens]
MDQLKQTPTNISLLSLLMSFESHRKLLIKVLNETHMDKNISFDQFGEIVGNIMVNNYLTFLDEGILVEGRGHNRALNNSIKCLDHLLIRVLIDNGSSLNVMPKATLEKLPYNQTRVRDSSTLVRAFDGSKREVMGEIEISLIVVCSADPRFILRVSPLHKKLKVIVDDKLVIIVREKNLLVGCPQPVGYIEVAKEALETASLEIANTTHMKSEPKKGKALKPMTVVAKMMIKKRFRIGQGLGKNLNGIPKLIELKGNLGRKRLGYQPEMSCMKSHRQHRRGSTNLYENFISKGYTNQVEEAYAKEGRPESFVRPCSSQEEPNN